MAEPLKRFLGPDVPAHIADTIVPIYSDFDHESFFP